MRYVDSNGTKLTFLARILRNTLESIDGCQRYAPALLSSMALLWIHTTCTSTCWSIEVTLRSADATADGHFGNSVSVRDDTAIVGASLDDGATAYSGSAFVYHRDGGGAWRHEAKLTIDDDGSRYERFGKQVALFEDTALISSYYDAYFFKRDAASFWHQVSKFKAPNPFSNSGFADSLALGQSLALIGAWNDDSLANGAGLVYAVSLNESEQWATTEVLQSPDLAESQFFGYSLAISENLAIIGASGDDVVANSAGAAYIFEHDATNGWTSIARLVADDAAEFDFFGTAVDIDGDTAVVGTPFDGDPGPDDGRGAVYIFNREDSGDWVQSAKLTPSEGISSFGNSVAIEGTTLAVSSHGGVSIYERAENNSWIFTQRLTAQGSSGQFAGDVALSSGRVLVGDTGYSDAGFRSGAAYVFRIPELSTLKLIAFALMLVAGVKRRYPF